ncbi:hypothetical protein GJS26_01784 [Pectobacterium carotovorum subsp. carotovorum]|nr:hypothetical protein [Pectobacterium carotovorum subsp. carotovorum]
MSPSCYPLFFLAALPSAFSDIPYFLLSAFFICFFLETFISLTIFTE